jgi:hypothetical protein
MAYKGRASTKELAAPVLKWQEITATYGVLKI